MYDWEIEDIWSQETYERIIIEIQDYLQLYLFKDSTINSELAVTRLFDLDEENILILKKLHFIISKEVEDFVKILPYLVRNLSHSTNKEEIETHGNIIGQIDWNQTLKQRMKTGLKDKSLFVCNTNKKLYDLPENQLLKYLLNKINKFIKDINISFNENIKENITNYQDYISNIHIITSKTIKNVHLKEVELPRYITTKTINKTIKSHNNLYESVVKVYDLYEKLFILNDESELLNLLNKQVLTPNNMDTLYEVYILFKIIEKIDNNSIQMALLKSGKDYTFHSEFEDKEVNIYYQHLPEVFQSNNLKKLRPYYNLKLTNKRPDIIVEYVKKGKKTYKIIEIKRTQNPNYIRDSIYKVFGYLKDYEKVKLEQPNILVVWDGIELEKQDNLNKQELIILNHNEFLNKINDFVLYEKDRIDTKDYWKELKQYHERNNSTIGNYYDDNWYAIDLDDIPYKIANIQLKIYKRSIEIQLYHIFFRDIFNYLYSHAEEIETEIGETLIWKARNSKRLSSSISLTKEIDFTNIENWKECIEWHSQMINKFKEVFIKYLSEYDLTSYRVDAQINTRSAQKAYWTRVNQKFYNTNEMRISQPEGKQWHIININSQLSHIALKTDYNKKKIGIELFIPRSKELFTYLEDDKDKIEEELGYKLIWQNNKKQTLSKILLYYDKYNPKHEELWIYCRKWHLDMLNKFYETLYPRIREFEKHL